MNKLNFAHMGNGIVIYRRDIMVENDHPVVAIISIDRVVKYCRHTSHYLTRTMSKEIEQYAKCANPQISHTQKQKVFTDEAPTYYMITGILPNGKRFDPIITTTPQHYNIYKGTLWQCINDKRKFIKRYNN